ncbi:hypothetical protein HNR44_002585 [Geomicrobium halophilum]|uniref:DUF370 domain-containing protein n=1 Tax=Geomicrobium halophilum TaxID=549000 RepID=A0A841Q023_9BACL|nr:extracellular matrix/biofilm biosynthesis regulator RemA family protein [Geomicrobium halophilum]MBB6450602.1 hypothetical protein [Geomicrobium halophilum]
MFVHIGRYTVIRSKDIVAILNYDMHECSSINQQYLEAQQEEDIVRITDDSTKSLVITTDKLYYSPISSTTLKRRSQTVLENLNDEDKENIPQD